MKVLMLGWEYPPHISGGLGTACAGLSQALARAGVEIDFIVPHLHGDEQAAHIRLLDPLSKTHDMPQALTSSGSHYAIPSLLSPYLRPKEYKAIHHLLSEMKAESLFPLSMNTNTQYNGDLIGEVYRFAEQTALSTSFLEPDLIHAHDWMTYPAGASLREKTGRPLVVHVHSIEADRAGNSVNLEIEKIEKAGCEIADRVIAVSHYTKRRLCSIYGIPEQKITVVHNGIDLAKPTRKGKNRKDKKKKSFSLDV